MKRGLMILVAVLFGITGLVYAANSDTVTVYFSVQNLSVDIEAGAIDFGTLQAGAFNIAGSSISVLNDGNGNETYQLSCSTWTANFTLTTTTPTPSNQFRVLAVFNGTAQPSLSAYDPGFEDCVYDIPETAGATKFAGSETGVSVPQGQRRGLWLRIDTPTGNPPGGQQSLVVTVTAISG